MDVRRARKGMEGGRWREVAGWVGMMDVKIRNWCRRRAGEATRWREMTRDGGRWRQMAPDGGRFWEVAARSTSRNGKVVTKKGMEGHGGWEVAARWTSRKGKVVTRVPSSRKPETRPTGSK